MANEKTYESMEELVAASQTAGVEYATIEGFAPGQVFRIGSITAGDFIEWQEANEGESKRTAGIRLILKSLVNSKNERFAVDDKNIAKFREVKIKVTERIVKEILKLNGLPEKNQVDAKKD